MKKSVPKVETYKYRGDELAMFSQARNWKGYLADRVRPYIRGDVLEVGSGMCAMTLELCEGSCTKWVCLEPDPDLARRGREALRGTDIERLVEIRVGKTSGVSSDEHFDSIIYINVLEHIQDDRSELQRAADLLKPGGAVSVLAPAHQCLFSPLDAAVGHCRRYDRGSLREMGSPRLIEQRITYLDSIGMLASLANRFVLRRSRPTDRQLRFWDSILVRLSRLADPLMVHACGKTVMAVWRKPSEEVIFSGSTEGRS